MQGGKGEEGHTQSNASNKQLCKSIPTKVAQLIVASSEVFDLEEVEESIQEDVHDEEGGEDPVSRVEVVDIKNGKTREGDGSYGSKDN